MKDEDDVKKDCKKRLDACFRRSVGDIVFCCSKVLLLFMTRSSVDKNMSSFPATVIK